MSYFVIRVVATGVGNNRCLIRYGPAYVADDRRTWDAGWYGRLGRATKVYKLKRNAERWLKEHPSVEGEVVEDPRGPNSVLR